MRNILIFMLMALCFSGCAPRGIGGSYVGALPGKASTKVIAGDAAAYLANEYAPGHTALYVLTPDKNVNNAFSAAMDASLRGKGFTLASTGSKDVITVGYTLDALKDDKGDETAWYLQLRLSDGKSVARSYRADGSPEAGRSSVPLEKFFLNPVSAKSSGTDSSLESEL